MDPKIVKADTLNEYITSERCLIAENFRFPDEKMSIARARVEPGVTTEAHSLKGVDEVYLIVSGEGEMFFDDLEPEKVVTGDLIVIPAGTRQRIRNIGKSDLVFHCICSPSFSLDCYVDEER